MRYLQLSRYNLAVYFCCTVLVAASAPIRPAGAWEIRGDAGGGCELVGRIEVPAEDLTFRRVEGFDLAEIEGGQFLTEPGKPMLPAVQLRVALPAGMSAVGLQVLETTSRALVGSYKIFPAQPPQVVSGGGDGAEWVPPDRDVYASDTSYPAVLARLVGQTDLAGQGMAIVEICPLEYRPQDEALRQHTTMTLAISCAPGYVSGDYLRPASSIDRIAQVEAAIREMVINPEQVQAVTSSFAAPPTRLDPGDFDYVIISKLEYGYLYEPLVEWKTRKGVPATLVTAEWIYNEGGYSGSDEEMIRAFIIDAHNEWGADYFLIGGDTNKIPCHWKSTPIEPYTIPNDTYYADFDDDWTVEVNVGRVAARYEVQVMDFINKVMAYETAPPLTGYAKGIAMLGFDLDGYTFGEQACEIIESQYIPGDWDVTEVYDSHAGDHRDAAIAALDAGQNLVNHIDHSDQVSMGVGSIHHDLYLYNYHVNALINGDEQSILYSIGCWACNYEYAFCIAENFVQNANGGAIAFIGNSRYGWFNPGTYSTLSFQYNNRFFRSLLQQGHYNLGEAFSDHKNDYYPSNNTCRYVFTELTLLGDPELQVWTDDPGQLEVSYPVWIMTGCNDLTVHVEEAGGGNLQGALVCLWKESDVYLTALTGSDGNAVFDPSPATDGEMLVTVTKRNFIPHQGDLTVLSEAGAEQDDQVPSVFRLYPSSGNPFRSSTEIRYDLPREAEVDLSIYDLAGRRVRLLVGGGAVNAGRHAVAWDGRDDGGRMLPAGIYLYRLKAETYNAARRLVFMK